MAQTVNQTSKMLNCEVCCIGGGITGLTACHDLCESFSINKNENKKNIILIESANRLGGRIMPKKWQVINPNNNSQTKLITIDVGAAYLHGIETDKNRKYSPLVIPQGAHIIDNNSSFKKTIKQITTIFNKYQ